MKLGFRALLYLTGSFITLVVAILIAVCFYTQQQYDRWGGIEAGIRRVHVIILENRRREKDFLLRLDLQYQDAVRSQTREILNHLRELEQSAIGPEGEEVLQRIREDVQRYARVFDEVVALYFKRGLSEGSGLRGELREAVHVVERLLDSHNVPALTSQMLMLRRHEKDYLLRRNQKYADLVSTHHERFLTMLEETALPPDARLAIRQRINSYLEAFAQIPLIDTEKAEKIEEFRDAAHQVERNLESLLRLGIDYEERLAVIVQRVLGVTSVVAIAGTLVLFYLLFVSKAVAVQRLQRLLDTALRGDLAERYPLKDASNGRYGAEDLRGVAVRLNRFLELVESFRRGVLGLADGDLSPQASVDLPEAYADILQRLRMRLLEFDARSAQAVRGETGAGPADSGKTSLQEQTARLLVSLGREGLALADQLLTGVLRQDRGNAIDLRAALERMEAVSRAVVEQSRLLAALTPDERLDAPP